MLFDTGGNVVAAHYCEYGAEYPKPGWVEQDQVELIEKTMLACRASLEKADVRPGEIVSIGFCTQRSVTCPVYRDGSPVRTMISWQDARTGDQVEQMRAKIDDAEFYDTCGVPMGTTWLIAKILWMQRHQPELFEKTHKFVQVMDVVLRAFGADDFHTDVSSAAFYGLWDVKQVRWSDRLMNLFEMSPDRFGRPTPAGTRIGAITKPVAEKTGFAPGTPICLGAGDQNCGAVGMGAVRPGIGTVTLGTCGMAILATDRPVPGFGGMMSTNHAVPGMWEIEGLTNAGASVLRWFRDTLGEKETAAAAASGRDAFELLAELASTAEPGAKGLLFMPYLATAASPRWNHDARAAFVGLSFAHGRAEMVRSVMEGAVLEIRDIMQQWFDANLEVDALRIGGGAAKSPFWSRIQADVYGRPVQTLAVEESTCLGAALLGGVGVGLFASIDEGVEAMVRVTGQIDPDPRRHELYEELYEAYAETYRGLAAGAFEKISRMQNA